MSACQDKRRLTMVETRRFPAGSCMTLGTVMIEVAILMIGIFHRSILILMTAITDARSARVAGFVTRSTIGTSMRPCQWEACQVVIDCCR